MLRTPLYNEHISLGAKIVEFAGWEMPLQYSGIIDEHLSVRKHVGLFDVSHMGEILVFGDESAEYLSWLTTANLVRKKRGHASYVHLLNENGGIIDDMIVYKIEDDTYLIIPNAAMVDRVYNWLMAMRNDFNINIQNKTRDLCCLALQGPEAEKVLQNSAEIDLSSLKFFNFMLVRFSSNKIVYTNKLTQDIKNIFSDNTILLSRTGYTGEDGFEFVCNSQIAIALWKLLISSGVKPCGLGARDTLRLEKGFLLSGQDFNENRSTVETGWDFIVDWDHEFVGKDVLLRQKSEGVDEQLFGVEMKGSGVPRRGSEVVKEGEKIGTVTSGTYSPTLRRGIALAYIKSSEIIEGSEIAVRIRNKEYEAILKKPPFV